MAKKQGHWVAPDPYTVKLATIAYTGWRLLVAGGYGVGKTQAVMSLANHPDWYPMLVIDTDQGTEGAHGFREAVDEGRIRIVRPSDNENVLTFLETVVTGLVARPDNRPEWANVNSVVIDSLTATRFGAELSLGRESFEGKEKTHHTDVSRQNWQRLTRVIAGQIKRIGQAGLNLAATSSFDSLSRTLSFNPSLAKAIMHQFSQVWIAEVHYGTSHMLRVVRSDQYPTKLRPVEFRDALERLSIQSAEARGHDAETAQKELHGWLALRHPLRKQPGAVTIPELYDIFLEETGFEYARRV